MIKHKDLKGNDVETKVEDKKQVHEYALNAEDYYELDEYSEDACYVCNLESDPEHLMICDNCSLKVCHSYCAGYGYEIPNDDWFCRYCYEEIFDREDEEYKDASDIQRIMPIFNYR